jgi:hypothetical protein
MNGKGKTCTRMVEMRGKEKERSQREKERE